MNIRRALSASVMSGGGGGEPSGLNITIPLDDRGYGEFTNEQIEEITNYCLQFGESNPTDTLPDGFSLAINSIPIIIVSWMLYKGDFIIQGSDIGIDFAIGFGNNYVMIYK